MARLTAVPRRVCGRRSLVAAALVCACAPFSGAEALEPSINYALHCMGCHTPDGSEVPDRVPAIRDTMLPFARMSEGRKFLVQVPGASQSTLSDAELADLLNWMIDTLTSAGGDRSFARYTEEEVASYRKHVLTGVRATRERLLVQAGQ